MRHVYYRLGYYTQAAERYLEITRSGGSVPLRDAETYCVVAMAQQKLNHPVEAHSSLAKALESYQTSLGQTDGWDFADKLIVQILLREARDLLGDMPALQQTDSAKP